MTAPAFLTNCCLDYLGPEGLVVLILKRGNFIPAIVTLTIENRLSDKSFSWQEKGVKEKGTAGDSGCQTGVGWGGEQTFYQVVELMWD